VQIAQPDKRGFTMVELMVVVAIIGVLMGIFTMAMLGGRSSEKLLKSRNHLRQIAQWMDQYAGSHRDTVVPSRFDYLDENGADAHEVGGSRFYRATATSDEWLPSANPFRETGDLRADGIAQGSWADILWVDANLGSSVNFELFSLLNVGTDDVFGGYGPSSAASPGWWMYRDGKNTYANPLRSAAPNTYNYPKFDSAGNQLIPDWGTRGQSALSADPESRMIGLPTPIGAGAWEKDLPGFFAANNFFDARSRRDITGVASDPNSDRFVTHAQIRFPNQALYLVDSFRGEVIGGGPLEDDAVYEQKTRDAFTNTLPGGGGGGTQAKGAGDEVYSDTQEVDFRYSDGDMTLMLFLDGHIGTQSTWRTYEQLVGGATTVGRGVRVMNLDQRLP
jgi:prepilin-type N-terminal cleavage/methylation domain-containing protein